MFKEFEDKPLVSIVILSWNRKNDLKEGLDKLKEITYKNIEIIVIDNGSKDGTIEMIKNEFPTVNLISLSDNRGVAGYNLGFKKARGEYIVVLDDDSYPAQDAIEKSVRVLEGDKNIVGIAFNIVNPQTRISETVGWPEKVFVFIGCGAMLRKSIVEKANYYDSNFFLYCNELDLSIKMLRQKEEYSLKYFPEIVAYHKTAASHRSGKRRAYYELRNYLWIIWQYFPLFWAIRLTFRRIFEEFIFAFTWHKNFPAYFLGIFDAFRSLIKYLKKRKVISHKLARRMIINSTNIFGEPIFKFLLKGIIKRNRNRK